MDALLLLAVILPILLTAGVLTRTILLDGRGHLPPPDAADRLREDSPNGWVAASLNR